ncbi:putative toxin-antitoxin system toxin component, PIN family [Deinococcus peraridilitoris]|uniref:Putative toxin-antitoxin system toxin component, PIN family n=1 Tax=Deinococcus peraridilitoris (strain DSM 19664 / LMG 22246 / CIP 109416 / KR-200) TaxID=937777 RepID=L0A0Y5_DEIPD|nr:putative toxin-antitoxin system toxin component, PIN family [Deinococcus peraridilitoris]AFZ66655.1 putative toxin-antitoxin system toxin component, PIN family [Deinococcus peraridilitoris DSM 19664]
MKALRLVPDVNVLLSGLTSRFGPSFDLYQAAPRFEVVFVLSETHFTELAEVLTYQSVLNLGQGIVTPSFAFRAASELHRIGEYHEQVEHLDWPSCRDPKDWYLLDLLVASGADGIVTKDKHLLRLRNLLNIPVVEPRELTGRLNR